MNYEFLPEADEEFREASRYYENEAPGVGLAFIAEVHRVISVGPDLKFAANPVGNKTCPPYQIMSNQVFTSKHEQE